MGTRLASQQLPEAYQLTKEFDLSNDARSKALLSLASLVLFFLFWWLFRWLLGLFRPGRIDVQSRILIRVFGLESIVITLLVLLALTFVMVFLHEGIHGLFFWIFTGEKPRFGFKIVYAFAGAPGWYIKKLPYLVIGIAPLVIITLVGFLLLLVVPVPWVLPILFFITLNASGAAGDIYTVFWLLGANKSILVHDTGDTVTVFDD